MHDLRADPVEIHVVEHPLGLAGVRGAVEVAVARHGPTLETRRAHACEVAHAALHERFDLEVLLPEAALTQMLREAGAEQVGGLDDVAVGRDDKVPVQQLVVGHARDLPAVPCGPEIRPTGPILATAPTTRSAPAEQKQTAVLAQRVRSEGRPTGP